MPDDALRPEQREVVRLFFSMPDSDGFVLVGGAALVAPGLTDRPTEDVDIAHDTAASRPLVNSDLGPTFDPLEHAARKALAVFDRAEARDFVDLYRLSTLFSNAQILALAGELDLGFDERVFAQSLRSINRFRDNALPCEPDDRSIVRSFANDWADELEQSVGHRTRTT